MFVEERLLDVISFSFIYIHSVKLLTSYSFWLSRLAAFHNSKCLSPREVKLIIFAASEVHASYTNANLCRSDWVWFY